MWIRKFRLEVTVKGLPTIVYEDLRMDFRYNELFSVGEKTNMANTFDIDIYNLSVASHKALVSTDKVQVKFYAGYQDTDKLDLVFNGIAHNVTGRRALPEYITTLHCIPIGLAQASKSISYKGKREDTVRDVILGIAKQLGIKSISYEGTKQMVSEDAPSHTITGNGIAELIAFSKTYFFLPIIEDSHLRITALPEANKISTLKSHKLNAELLRGIPEVTTAWLSIPYSFNRKFKVGEAIDVTELLGKRTNALEGTGIGEPSGVFNLSGIDSRALHYSSSIRDWAMKDKYQIMGIYHAGSNYTDQFISYYNCVCYAPNLKGAKTNGV